MPRKKRKLLEDVPTQQAPTQPGHGQGMSKNARKRRRLREQREADNGLIKLPNEHWAHVNMNPQTKAPRIKSENTPEHKPYPMAPGCRKFKGVSGSGAVPGHPRSSRIVSREATTKGPRKSSSESARSHSSLQCMDSRNIGKPLLSEALSSVASLNDIDP